MAVTDLTGYTWIGNAELVTFNIFSYNINFLSNNTNYSSIKIVSYHGKALRYDDDTVYVNPTGLEPGWEDEAYKTIQIIGGDDVTDADLIAWLQANGTLTAPEPPQPSSNNLKIGNKDVIAMYIGDKEVQKQYIGNVLVYSKGEPPLPQLDTPQNVTADGTTISFDPVENAESYEIFADGVSIGEYTPQSE